MNGHFIAVEVAVAVKIVWFFQKIAYLHVFIRKISKKPKVIKMANVILNASFIKLTYRKTINLADLSFEKNAKNYVTLPFPLLHLS